MGIIFEYFRIPDIIVLFALILHKMTFKMIAHRRLWLADRSKTGIGGWKTKETPVFGIGVMSENAFLRRRNLISILCFI